jgi:TRAP-type C4-dicarboxylate transport system substrate-binding protein
MNACLDKAGGRIALSAQSLGCHAAYPLAIGLVCSGSAGAETWKMATKQPADGPEGKVFQYFADQAAKHSGGKVTVQVFPNEQLGKEAAILEQLKIGTVQLYAEGSVFLQKWVPDIRWSNAPFLFDDRDHWVRLRASDGQGWFDKAKTEAGIVSSATSPRSCGAVPGGWDAKPIAKSRTEGTDAHGQRQDGVGSGPISAPKSACSPAET